MKTNRKRFAAAALAAALLLQPLIASTAWAQSAQSAQHNAANQFFTGFGCFLVSPVYGAFKVAFGMLGGIVGTFAWALSGGDVDTANRVWNPTMRGTYVISPEHMRGERAIVFFGPR